MINVKTTLKIHLQQEETKPTISSFRSIENKYDVYRGKDCMKKFWELLKEYAMKTINFKMKKMKLLTRAQQKPYETAKICYIFKKKFETNYQKDKNIIKLEIIVIIHGNRELLRIPCVIWSKVYLKNSYSFS